MSLEFRLTRDEFMTFARWQFLRTKALRGVAVMTVVIIGIGIALIAGSINTQVGAIVLGIGILQVLAWAWILTSTPRRAWARQNETITATYMQFSPAGVHVRTRNVDAFTEWGLYPRTIENGPIYLLEIAGGTSFRVIPKRAFDSPDDEQLFRRLTTEHTATAFR